MVARGMTNLRVISNHKLRALEAYISPALDSTSLRVMCATDLWGQSDHALQKALWLAETTDVELQLLHVVDGEMPMRLTGRRADHARSALEWRLRRWPHVKPRPAISVRVGNPHRTISRVAREWRADFVVLGSSRRGTTNRFVATTAERVASEAQCAVLIINRDPSQAYADAAIVATSCCRAAALEDTVVKFQILKRGSRPQKLFLVNSSNGSRTSTVPERDRDHSRCRRIRMNASASDVTQAVLRAPLDLVVLESDRWPTLAGLLRRSVTRNLARSTAADLLITPRRKVLSGPSVRCARVLSAAK